MAAAIGVLPLACTPVESVSIPVSESSDPPTAMTPLLLKTRAWLVGSFSSAAQADRDPDFRAIERHVVPIWTDRVDGPWLYVEMATAEAPAHPYRQRIYRLLPVIAANGRDAVLLLPHRLPGDGEGSGSLWRTPEHFDAIAPGELEPMTGCGVSLHPDGPGRIHGSTNGRECASTFGGVAYTTSEVELFKDRIETFDRGYDAGGVQLRGSEHGPYRFDRVESR